MSLEDKVVLKPAMESRQKHLQDTTIILRQD